MVIDNAHEKLINVIKSTDRPRNELKIIRQILSGGSAGSDRKMFTFKKRTKFSKQKCENYCRVLGVLWFSSRNFVEGYRAYGTGV